MDPLFDNTDPPDPLDMLTEVDKMAEESLLGPEIVTSARKSEDEDDGARVAMEDPTGYGETGMSEREDAEGQ